MENSWDLVVIGGGAAGFFCAAEIMSRKADTRLLILERGHEVLGKVRVSGGGRCNVTHDCMDPRVLVTHYPRGQKALLGPFTRFGCKDTIAWYESRGVPLKVEADGRMFPASDDSASIVDCLVQAAQGPGLEIRMGQRVDALTPPATPGGLWTVTPAGREPISTKMVLVATGSNTRIWELLAGIGLKIVSPVPSLFTFQIKDERLEGLPGLSVPDGVVTLPGTKLQNRGPVLITHWGLSGPGVLRLSAFGARALSELDYKTDVLVNWTGMAVEQVQQRIQEFRTREGSKKVAAQTWAPLPMRLYQRLLHAAGIREDQRWADLNKQQVRGLVRELCEGVYPMTGKSTFKEEFVTAGGVDLKEVDFKTFEARKLPGLFLAGEVLDIDAVTGGFNFQAAWTGGYLAAEAIVDRLC